ncbi:MAG: peptide chain release factor N(5)-glutamine methyltransferase [Candidatus Tumulicola sp.]
MLVESAGRLGALGDSGHSDAQILLAHVLGRSRAWLFAHGEALVSTPEAQRFGELCARRAVGVPIAYLLGSAYFYGREFAVDETVLVPRPETETLVDYALQFAKRRGSEPFRILDVGTGSGALACTLAAELPSATIDATDCSAGALAVARANAFTIGVDSRCHFYLGDLAGPVADLHYDAIVANLPYVATADIPAAPDPLAFEPRIALDGGPDGLRAYARLLPQLPRLLVAGGLALLEAAPHLMGALRALCEAAFSKASVAIGRDLGGLERFVIIVLPEA